MSDQLDLFDSHSLNPIPRVKEALRRAAKASPLSREQIVDTMNDLARIEGLSTNGRAKQISIDMLEKWLTDSAAHLMPWHLLPIFCQTVKSVDPLKALCAPLNAQVIEPSDAALLTWARYEMEKREIKKHQRRLEGEIKT